MPDQRFASSPEATDHVDARAIVVVAVMTLDEEQYGIHLSDNNIPNVDE